MSQMHSADAVAGDLSWRKSRRSGKLGNCVELAATGDHVAMRNSRQPDGTILAFPAADMAAFLGAIKQGELDDLA